MSNPRKEIVHIQNQIRGYVMEHTLEVCVAGTGLSKYFIMKTYKDANPNRDHLRRVYEFYRGYDAQADNDLAELLAQY